MTAVTDEKIKCELCGAETHAIQIHLKEAHRDVTLAQYQEQFPGAPLMSEFAKARVAAARAEKEERIAPKHVTEKLPEISKKAMAKVFSLGSTKSAKRADGGDIMIEVLGSSEWDMQIPDIDDNYIFNIDILKTMLMGIALNIPTYLWGHAGTGKSTIIEQISCRTRRPMIRVQHTGSTEESHIIGQMVADMESGTKWSPGPLPMAMKYGFIYLADEYDFAYPQVLAVYQAVLEGKALVIKEAPADSEWRVVHPHPNFRFFATGNTNGSGDTTGLYQGTNMQNAANYERFGIVEEMPYMSAKQEAAVVAAQAGIALDDAEKLVSFASLVRNAFDARQIRATCGPRVLINAGRVAVAKASFLKGLHNAFLNRLSPKDKEICLGLAQRILGS